MKNMTKSKTQEVTGEDLASLLFHIHSHDLKTEEIIYYEKDLLPILKALGLPKPIWGDDISVKKWLKNRKDIRK